MARCDATLVVFLFVCGACGTDPAPAGPDAGGHGPDAPPASAQTLGSPCSCTDSSCDQAGVPEPTHGPIQGCDHLPSAWPGGARACLRSYAGSLATSTYFANGYCALMAATCSGSSLICNSATAGDYAALVDCPPGAVLLEDTQQVSVLGAGATIQSKLCVQGCAAAGQCRESETDPVWSGSTQEQCLDKAGVKFCYDARNLSSSYTVTPF
jgi:hypothetical protein